MPTRLYCTSGAAAVTPSDWEFPAQANTVTVPGTTTQNTGFAMTTAAGNTDASGNPVFRALGRLVFGPLAAQTVSGTLTGQMRVMESNSGANATLAVSAKVITPAGADRGILLAPTAADNTDTRPPEMVVGTLTNRPCQNSAESTSLTLTAQTATAGDYLVVEWGFRCNVSSIRTITSSYGNDNATDLTAGNTDETAALNPWFQFSGTLLLFESQPEAAATDSTAVADALQAIRLPVLPLSRPDSTAVADVLQAIRLPVLPVSVQSAVRVAASGGGSVALPPLPLSAVSALSAQTTVLLRVPVLLASLTAPLTVTDSAGAHLPWLTRPVTTAVRLTLSVAAHLPTLPSQALEAVGVLGTAVVRVPTLALLPLATLPVADLPTVLVPVLTPVCAEALRLTALGLPYLPWLSPMPATAVRLADTPLLRLPLLRLSASTGVRTGATPTVQRAVEGVLQVGTITETLPTAAVVTLRVPWLSSACLDVVPVADAPSTLVPRLPLAPMATVPLATTLTVHLPWLTAAPATVLALQDTAAGQVPRLHVSGSTGVRVSAAPAVLRSVEGLLQVGRLTETLPVATPPTVVLPVLLCATADGVTVSTGLDLVLPVLSCMATASLRIGTSVVARVPRLHVPVSDAVPLAATPTVFRAVPGVVPVVVPPETLGILTAPSVRLPLLSCAGSVSLRVQDSATVIRMLEGVLTLPTRTATLSLAATVTLRLPQLPVAVASGITSQATAVLCLPRLPVGLTESLGVATVLTGPIAQAGGIRPTTTVHVATHATVAVPWLRAQTSDTVAVTTLAPQFTIVTFGRAQVQARVAVQAGITLAGRLHLTSAETLPVGTSVARGLPLALTSTATLAVAASPTLHLALAPHATDQVVAGEAVVLTGTLHPATASLLPVRPTARIETGVIYVHTAESLRLGTSPVRLYGLSLRGVHADTPALHVGRMAGTLRQADTEEETLSQADVEDAILV